MFLPTNMYFMFEDDPNNLITCKTSKLKPISNNDVKKLVNVELNEIHKWLCTNKLSLRKHISHISTKMRCFVSNI